MSSPEALRVQDLTMHYSTRQGEVHAVDGISFTVRRGEALGLVGESGCGKTSVALCLMKVLPDNGVIKGGHIYLDGVDLVPLKEDEMRRYRWKRISMVFQGAMSSLNPVYRVGEQLVEAILAHEAVSTDEARGRVAELFRLVGLEPELLQRYPHEYSGGMKQRAVIAQALACRPDVVVADEPTTALDVIVQDRILRLLRSVQREMGTAVLYISHDIAAMALVCDRIGVMYAGKLVELASTEEVFRHPLHPYTDALVRAIPSLRGEKQELASIPGEPPDLLRPPSGCRFYPRCPNASEECRAREPELREYRPGHWAATWHPLLDERRERA